MKRTIIYPLTVKGGAKLQFQIKLPSDTKGIEAIHVTHPFVIDSNVGYYPIISNVEVGWLWLRVPDQRDVFFADVLRPQIYQVFEGLSGFSIDQQPSWYQSGTKQEFFTMHVPIKHTIISGFYWDRLADSAKDTYQIKIYLKLY